MFYINSEPPLYYKLYYKSRGSTTNKTLLTKLILRTNPELIRQVL